jgi:hypothetical protein
MYGAIRGINGHGNRLSPGRTASFDHGQIRVQFTRYLPDIGANTTLVGAWVELVWKVLRG